MKTLTVAEAARKLSSVVEELERDQEEVVLVRENQKVARLVPEPPSQNALEVLGDLYRGLDGETADALVKAIDGTRKGKGRTLKSLRDPWGS
jgi:antitoxin (DNA-binding transcriptional repressor) of toxin-antitoxin stability system